MRTMLKAGLCAFAGIMMQAAVIAPAHAEYPGYGNGDPGGWDFATEQAGGPCNLPGGTAIDAATGQASCCSQYNPSSACPLFRSPTRYYRHVPHQRHQ